MNVYDMSNFANLYETILKINERYKNKELTDGTDEKGANGYWDLAGELTGWYDNAQDVMYKALKSFFLNRKINVDRFIELVVEARTIALVGKMNSLEKEGVVFEKVEVEKTTTQWLISNKENGEVIDEIYEEDTSIVDTITKGTYNTSTLPELIFDKAVYNIDLSKLQE